jgi:hypothetical protein
MGRTDGSTRDRCSQQRRQRWTVGSWFQIHDARNAGASGCPPVTLSLRLDKAESSSADTFVLATSPQGDQALGAS